MQTANYPILRFTVVISIVALFFVACKKESPAQAEMPSATAQLKYRGVFKPTSGISITGVAKIVLDNNAYQLVIDSFSVSNGPDLKVYLSKNSTPTSFINLGALKSFSGRQLYEIPGMVNFAEYKYVLIYCQQHNHLFGYAELNP